MIAYTSRQLKKLEISYLTHEVELAEVDFTMKIWKHYIYGETCQLSTSSVSSPLEKIEFEINKMVRID